MATSENVHQTLDFSERPSLNVPSTMEELEALVCVGCMIPFQGMPPNGGRFAGRHLLVAPALLSDMTLRALGLENLRALSGVAGWSLRKARHGEVAAVNQDLKYSGSGSAFKRWCL